MPCDMLRVFLHDWLHIRTRGNLSKYIWDHFVLLYAVWKTVVLCRGNVRPSFRPRFADFFQHVSRYKFELSTFSRWHDISTLSSITTEPFWPTLQPKVGETHCLQSWPHRSRKILEMWYINGPLHTSRVKFRFCFQKSYFWNSGDYFYAFWNFRSFPFFFSTCSEVSIWNFIYTLTGRRHRLNLISL